MAKLDLITEAHTPTADDYRRSLAAAVVAFVAGVVAGIVGTLWAAVQVNDWVNGTGRRG